MRSLWTKFLVLKCGVFPFRGAVGERHAFFLVTGDGAQEQRRELAFVKVAL